MKCTICSKDFLKIKWGKTRKFCSRSCYFKSKGGKPTAMIGNSRTWTEEQRKNLSKNNVARRPEVRLKISQALKGRKKSREQIAKMVQSKKGFHHTQESRKQISLWGKGKSYKELYGDRALVERIKRSEAKKGSKNYFWKGGLTQANLLVRNSLEYKFWREAVFKRDNYTCVKCGARGGINADHIKPFSLFPELRFELTNGRTLCVPCHQNTDTYGTRLWKSQKSYYYNRFLAK